MSKNRVEAVERALTILQSFSEDERELTLAQLAEKTGFYKSTILRLTNSLIYMGFMVRDDKGLFSLGSELWRLGTAYRHNFELAEAIRPLLDKIRDATEETASFYIRDGDKRVCLYRANSRRSVRHHLDEGVQFPLNQGAAGKALLAFSKKPPRELTENLSKQLADIKQQGYAYSLGERNPEVGAIAVPLLDNGGEARGVLCVSGLIQRFDDDNRNRYLQVLQDSVKQLQAVLTKEK